MAKKSSWLEEVKKDAERLTLKRIRDQKEEAEYQASKLADADEPEVKKGK